MTAFVDDIQAELSVYFDEILSQMADGPLPEEAEAYAELQGTLKTLQAPIQPVVDDGGAIPQSVLGKEYRLGPHSLRVEDEDGKLTLHASFYGEPVVLPRGRTGQYLLKTSLRANETGIAVLSPSILGYGVHGGKLALRILALEFMFDVSIELGEAGLEAWHVYDVNHHKRIEHIGF
jgi:hypothetical protein